MSEWVPNDGIEDGEGEENELPQFNGREGTIYLIDAAKYVNDPNKSIAENQEQFLLCLECIEADLLKSILINSRDLVSVVFYNTLHSPVPNARFAEDADFNTVVPKKCAVFIPLKPLGKELIQYFKNFKESDDFFNFAEEYGSSDDSCFSEALWLCSRMIMRSNYKLVYSKIILFTNNELPHPNGTQEQQKAFVGAKDLNENNTEVDLVPMVDEFDMEPFFKEFLSAVAGEDPEEFRCYGPMDQRYQLLNRLYRANYKKSCLRHLNLTISNGVEISCDIFSGTRTAKKPNAVKMFRENNEIVVGKRSYETVAPNVENADESVERKVLPSEIYKSQVIVGKEIVFSPEEVIKMKTILNPGLQLLGFKPLDQLRPRWMIKHCLFLYPNEKKTIGSTTLFRALWEKCLEKQKYALCTLTMRRFTTPKYVALVPHTVELHGNDGFCIIHLPMQTNVGVLDSVLKPLPEPTPEQISLFEKLCKKLRFKYRPEMFANPSLQSFYTNLEALVYDEAAKDIEDLTLPQYSLQDSKLEPFLEAIEEEFGTEVAASGSRSKRGNDGDASGARPKASKKNLSSHDVVQAIRNGRMEAVTVQHLKDFLRDKNTRAASTATKKALFELAQKCVE